MLTVATMNEACKAAELAIIKEDWASDRFTIAVWGLNQILATILRIILWIPDIIISIPRALLTVIPILNLPYLLLGHVVYFAFFGPVLGASWLWREAPPIVRPVVRPPLALIGTPLAQFGSAIIGLMLMGGPLEHGANKYYKTELFESFPLTVDMSSRVEAQFKRRYGVDGGVKWES